MKKLKVVLIVLITSIFVGGISIYATYNYLASDVKYTKKSGEEINVEEALNELYQVQNNSSNICFAGMGGSYKSTWTNITYSVKSLNSSICSLSNSTITFLEDCNITMKGSVFAGRRSNGSTNTAYIRVLVNGNVVYTSQGITNYPASNLTMLSNYDIAKDSTIVLQVYGTDETGKMHSIIIDKN